jgi:hypothetical protein
MIAVRCLAAVIGLLGGPGPGAETLSAMKAFAAHPADQTAREVFEGPGAEPHEVNDGWHRRNYHLSAPTFYCEVVLAVSPSSQVVAWQYYCGQTADPTCPKR